MNRSFGDDDENEEASVVSKVEEDTSNSSNYAMNRMNVEFIIAIDTIGKYRRIEVIQ
jgi:hypothetical protein